MLGFSTINSFSSHLLVNNSVVHFFAGVICINRKDRLFVRFNMYILEGGLVIVFV